jgi:NAD(P)-dependent dehydrogenase (short-subunit alcohol dehydrogenase family)
MKKRHVVITGARRGIGLELTRQLLASGDRVTALVRDPATSTELAALAKASDGRLRIGACDVASEDSVKSALSALALDREAIDVLINNAGVYQDASADLPELDLTKVLSSIDINAVGPMRVTRALLPGLEKAAKPVVVQITSLMGSIGDNGSGGSYAYRMSKAALNMFHKSFAVDYPAIIALTLHPGWVKTDMGGEQAPTSVDESARGLLKVINGAGKAQSGRFYDFEGDELPW